jgi:DNA-directed RNA polymerase subunit alpha
LQNRGFGFYFVLRSEFCNYAVGPWVSVAGRETALARGNPAKRRNFDLRFSNFDCSAVSVFNRQSKIDIRKYKMPIRYGRFEMPKTLSKEESTATDTYAKFTAEPFEAGYGHTVGNSLRRVLLSSLEGAAITAAKIAGAQHEFATLPGVVEDVTDIVLNLKKVKFKADDHEPKKLSLTVNKEGEVTAGDIQVVQGYEVLNPKQIICTLDKKHKFDAELDVRVGRGFATAEENKRADQAIGLIPIDSIFSPVTRVKYAVENTRVGQRTDYDKLILEIWTDGRLTPDDALLQASAILRHHLDVFVNFNEEVIEFDQTPAGVSEENLKLKKLLNMSVNEIELSVRAANCLNNANITSVGQLAQKTEAEMLKYRNFGKKSLNEIKDKLQQLGLSLGMKFEPGLLDVPVSSDGAGPSGAAGEE